MGPTTSQAFVSSLDPHKFQASTNKYAANFVYSRLFMFDSGPHVPRWKLNVIPDAAQSYEVTPDGLTYTIKLKGNVRFQPVDRLMDAEDVVFSVKRFMGLLPDYSG